MLIDIKSTVTINENKAVLLYLKMHSFYLSDTEANGFDLKAGRYWVHIP